MQAHSMKWSPCLTLLRWPRTSKAHGPTVLSLCWRSTTIKRLNILLHLQTSVSLGQHQRSPVQWVCTNRAPHNGQHAEALKHRVLNGISLSNSSPRGSEIYKEKEVKRFLVSKGMKTPRKHCLPVVEVTHELRLWQHSPGLHRSKWLGSQHQDRGSEQDPPSLTRKLPATNAYLQRSLTE